MSESQSRMTAKQTPSPSRPLRPNVIKGLWGSVLGLGTASGLKKPILIAGLLGIVLGSAAMFAAGRFLKPGAQSAPTENDKAAEEARHILEEFLAKLKEGKNEEFMAMIKLGYTFLTEEAYRDVKQKFHNSRLEIGLYGKPLNEFELLHQTAISPNLIQFVYLERFEHGAVIWRFVMYHGKESWRVAHLFWNPNAYEAFLP